MAKHPTSRRVHRTTTDDDKFVTGVLETSLWARAHSRWMTIVGVSLVVVLALFAYYRNVTVQRDRKAASELVAVRSTMMSGNQQLAKNDLQNFVKNYGGTSSGDVARLLLGQVELQGKEPQLAVTTLEPVAKDAGTPLGYSAALMLAAAYEANKQLDQADRTYLRIADDARFDFQKREALDRAARLRLERGNPNGAAELYERILAGFEKMDPAKVDMQQKNVYAMRLAEIRAQAPANGRS
jgi:predicted negative regulator of RcsB-dependent stress response